MSTAEAVFETEAEEVAKLAALESVRFIDILDELTDTDEMMLIHRTQKCPAGAASDVFKIFSAAHDRAVASIAAGILNPRR